MRSAVRVVLAAPILVAALVATGSSAQSITPCVRSVVFGIEPDVLGAPNGKAYTALVTKTFELRTYDGNTIHWTIQSMQARDEAGRLMRQHIEGCNIDGNGQPQLRIRTSIFDPAAKTDTSWSTGPGSMALATITHTHIVAPPNMGEIARVPYPRDTHPEITNEELGTRTIAGIEAIGRRRTEIIPAGVDGNDLPMKSVTETWTSVKDHAVLMMTTDHPRMGHYSWEVMSLTLGPPDHALFTPPSNYKVWDNEPQAGAAAKPQ